jgi:hypothetical protein
MLRATVVMVAWSAACVSCAFAQQSVSGNLTDDPTLTVKEIRGHRFSVPEDREVQKKHGVYILTPIDQYVAQKFQKMEERMAFLEAQVAQLTEQIAALQPKEEHDVSR